MENDRVKNQTYATTGFRSDEDVDFLRGVLGISSGVGLKKRMKVGSDRVR